jgi:hypothetical protein
MGQAQTVGQWQTLPNLMPINPVHVALMHNGKVLVVSGSGNLPSETNYQAAIFDPTTGTVTTQPIAWDMFCNGMIVLPDGRPFVLGGTLQYDPFHGEPRASIFDSATGNFTDMQRMAHGRWYPTATTLGDGRVMVFSGLSETGATNTAVEIYTVGLGWSPQYGASWTPPLYPRMHVLPNGTVFYSGPSTGSNIFDPATQTWKLNVATTNYSGTRTYGTSVLLPLTPANGYKPRVLILGGANPSTNTTELIDLSASTPKWAYGPPMAQPRIEMNATILPSGKVLALGGSTNDEDANTASLSADLYDPDPTKNSFSSAGANVYPRLYHSNSLLLPDATVLVVGGNPARGTYEQHMEIYSPAYLFNPDGTPATRPAITSVSPGTIAYGSSFQVATPNAATTASVVLIRAGAVTHAFDMDQRLVGLSFSVANSSVLSVTGPPNGNIAPPGYYLLFILNSAGVPSVAQFVRVASAPTDQPPTATITQPASDQIIVTGQAVSFAGTGTDPDGTISSYSWNFPGGSPSTSLLMTPGNVIFSTPGTYVASLTVTDNAGLTNVSPPTRTIVVENQPTLSTLSLNPSSVTGGTPSQGTVTLSAPAPTAGVSVSLSSGNTSAATVPATVNILGGNTSATFSINTSSVSSSTPVVITATYQGSQTATLTVNPSGTGGSGPAIDVRISADQSTPSTTVKTAAFSTNSGNELLLAFVTTDYISGANSTVTNVSGGGVNWALVIRSNVQRGSSEIWRAFATSPLSNAAVTATLSQSVVSSIQVLTFTGADTTGTNGSGAIGLTASTNAGSGAPTATLKTTRNNSWVFGVGNDYDNAIARTPGANQTLIHQYLTPTGDTYWVQGQNGVTPLSGTSVTINDTAPTGDRYNLALVEVLPPAVVIPTYMISGGISPTPASVGATVTLSGPANATATTDGSGNYSFANLANGTYTIKPSKAGYTFTPASQNVPVSGANVPSINFTIQPIPTYSIAGAIAPSTNANGTAVTLTGASTASTTPDANGNYTFSGLFDGNYTVTPTKSGYTFTPPSLPVTISGGNAPPQNFTMQAIPTYSVSGSIAPVANGSGATVSLAGASSASTTADSSGNYIFSGLANGTYTVTPNKSGFSFTPRNQTVPVNGANVPGINFTAQTATASSVAVDAVAPGDNVSASNSMTSAIFSTKASNELLLAFVATDYVSGSNTTVTSVAGAGLTWVLVVRSNTQSGTSEIWRAFAPSPLTNVSVTATVSQTVVSSIVVMSFTGIDTSGTNGSGAIGAFASGNANPGAPTAQLVTTRNNSLVVGVGNDYDNAISRTPGTAQSVVHQYFSPTGDTYWVQRQNVVTALSGTTVQINDTAPTGDRYNLAICEILAAP